MTIFRVSPVSCSCVNSVSIFILQLVIASPEPREGRGNLCIVISSAARNLIKPCDGIPRRAWARFLGMKSRRGDLTSLRSVSRDAISHVPFYSQFLHRVGVFLVLRAAGAFGSLSGFKFRDDIINRGRIRINGKRARRATKRAIALAILRKIKTYDRDIFALDVLLHIQLRPVKERMDPDMRVFVEIGLELVPKLGRLVLKIPLKILVPR